MGEGIEGTESHVLGLCRVLTPVADSHTQLRTSTRFEVVDECLKNGPHEWSLLPKMEGLFLKVENEGSGQSDAGLPTPIPS